MTTGEELRELLRQLRDLVDAAPAAAEPIKLTGAQLDQLRAVVPTRAAPDPAAWLSGTPIVLVGSTVESTPYLEGWIKCPSCGRPAVGHAEVVCDVTLVFGPFGDFMIRQPPQVTFGFDPAAWDRSMVAFDMATRRLLSDPGLTFGDLERVRSGILALAAAPPPDDGMAEAIARWEDDGGSCR